MPTCRYCDRDNPVGLDRCRHCGGWLEPTLPESATAPDETDAGRTASAAPEPDSLETQLIELMRQGQKIAAIKLCREQTGCGLKEAKDLVEALAARHGIAPKGAGCAAAVLAILLVVVTLAVGSVAALQ